MGNKNGPAAAPEAANRGLKHQKEAAVGAARPYLLAKNAIAEG
jgi:hypothetical protein